MIEETSNLNLLREKAKVRFDPCYIVSIGSTLVSITSKGPYDGRERFGDYMNKDKLKKQLLEELAIAAKSQPIVGCSQESEMENNNIVYKHKSYTMNIDGAIVTICKTTTLDNPTTFAIAAGVGNQCPISFSSEEIPSDLYNKIYTTLRKRYKANSDL